MKIYEQRVMGKEAILYYVLCKLVLEGRSEIEIPAKYVDDALAKGLRISIEKMQDRHSYLVHLSIDGVKTGIEEADYEIVEEPTALPQPPKQLPSETPHK